VGMIMAFPNLVTGNIEKVQNLSDSEVMQQLDIGNPSEEQGATPEGDDDSGAEKSDEEKAEDNDPMKALLESNERDARKR